MQESGRSLDHAGLVFFTLGLVSFSPRIINILSAEKMCHVDGSSTPKIRSAKTCLFPSRDSTIYMTPRESFINSRTRQVRRLWGRKPAVQTSLHRVTHLVALQY